MSQPLSGFVLRSFRNNFLSTTRKITVSKVNMERMEPEEINVSAKITLLAPTKDKTTYKGQAGKIGVFGGSLDYTGAPYFSAISSLKVGADLSYVFTTQSAAPVIKAYSPELIVHPYLDDEDVEGKIKPWIKKLNVAVIGPGLGRHQSTLETMKIIIKLCRETNGGIPLVIDADGLYFIAEELKKNNFMLKDYPNQVVLTPNHIEFERLVGENSGEDKSKIQRAENLLEQCRNLTIVCKGKEDEIFNSKKQTKVSEIGSHRRCGGQGDLLSGSLGTFLHWALHNDNILDEERVLLAAYAACRLTRECNYESYLVKGRSMLCTDMIDQIHSVFEKYFEYSKK